MCKYNLLGIKLGYFIWCFATQSESLCWQKMVFYSDYTGTGFPHFTIWFVGTENPFLLKYFETTGFINEQISLWFQFSTWVSKMNLITLVSFRFFIGCRIWKNNECGKKKLRTEHWIPSVMGIWTQLASINLQNF